MTQLSTRDRILDAALQLFSERGYTGVSMRDIASAVGIQAASIYNHFSGKEAIFNSLLLMMEERYESSMQQIGLPDDSAAAEFYGRIDAEQLQQVARQLFLYFLTDDFAARCRRMLTLEQYRDSAAGKAFHQLFFRAPIEYQAHLFAGLMEQGAFIAGDPETAALQFYAPIFLLLNEYDRKPKRQAEALERLDKHIRIFSHSYQAT